jgi:mitogen-activated protein kinase kinase
MYSPRCQLTSHLRDPTGRLNFKGKAVLHANGVNFANGVSYQLNMEDLERGEELGRGNYGTVTKVLHTPTGVTMALKVAHSYYSLHVT